MALEHYFDNSYFFGVAINDYHSDLGRLYSPINDVTAVAELLCKSDNGFSPSILPPDQTTQEGILNFLEFVVGTVNGENLLDFNRNRVIFYFAGHGKCLQEINGRETGYIIPLDADPNDERSWINMNKLVTYFQALKCRHLLVILDCCFAGSLEWSIFGTRSLAISPTEIFAQHLDFYANDRAWQALVSAAFDQVSVDVGWRADQRRDHSPFAQVLLEGLNGAADLFGTGLITASSLALQVREGVEKIASDAGIQFGQSPRLMSFRNHGRGEFLFVNPKHPINLRDAITATKENCPFKGLVPFGPNDSDKFFGRDDLIAHLSGFITDVYARGSYKLLPITGVSGSGKSSLVNSGIIPVLLEQGFVHCGTFRPNIKLLEQITSLNTQATSNASFIFIDQLEELFVDKALTGIVDSFIRKIMTDFIKPGKQLVIMTMRADFELLIPDGQFKNIWNDFRQTVPWFTRNELRNVIIRPAFNMAFFFQPETLVDQIIDDVIQYPGSLPMLSLMLQRLYYYSVDRDRDRMLVFEDYKSIGGIAGALGAALGDYDKKDVLEREILLSILIRMVNVENAIYTRKAVRNVDLVFENGEFNEHIKKQLQQLIFQRIIKPTENGKGWEPVHDAVARWNGVTELVNAIGIERMGIQVKLENDLETYNSHGKNSKDLWTHNSRLNTLRKEIKENKKYPCKLLNSEEIAFIKASAAALKKRRTLQSASILVAFMILLIFVIILLDNRKTIKQSNSNLSLSLTNEKKQRMLADSNLRQFYRAEFRKQISAGDEYFHARNAAENIPYLAFARASYDSARSIMKRFNNDPVISRDAGTYRLLAKIDSCKIISDR